MRTMRAFVAVPLGEEVVQAAARLSAELRRKLAEQGLSAKWVLPANLHVTVRFLGEIAEAQVPAIGESLGPLVGRHASFLVALRGLGCFPDAGRPSVLWAGFDQGVPQLERLAADVNRALDRLGFPEQDRPFHPHLTLARPRRGAPPPDLTSVVAERAAEELGSTVVRDVVLFRSTLRPKGPLYQAVWRGTLNPGGRREG
ncbi:MAG: RNA 2',3'-cyclic phosphodiesterase [Deltaproteobacteria bacterium]|nr:RNA 2',3'-cyclic phosphodiesterase [Deltaproteobacteria bacterium]